MCLCRYNWSRYPPLPIAVLIFCTHWVRPNPINHVCECLISTLLALVSFSWLSARFIMAFGKGVCGVCVCVWDVIHCYGSMLLNVSPCWGEECPECAVHAPGGGRQHVDTHICSFECVFVFLCVTFHCVLSLNKCVPVCDCVCMCESGCVLAHKCAKSLTRLRWHVSLFVTMVIVSGLSRDVHPDDEIRLHQWRGRAETNTGVSRGMSIERGCERGDARVGGMGPGNLLMECTKGIIKHTHI